MIIVVANRTIAACHQSLGLVSRICLHSTRPLFCEIECDVIGCALRDFPSNSGSWEFFSSPKTDGYRAAGHIHT